MRYAIIALITMGFLTSCETAPSRALPDVKTYSKKEQRQVGEELGWSCSKFPTVCEWLKDYKIMRDQTKRLEKNNG